jgi:glyoxylase-like metal-dependent hydrolase (beta-lactamase superfamily II)
MTHVDEVACGIYQLQTEIPGVPFGFAVYFIAEGGGVLIEPGPATIVPAVQAAMAHLGLESLDYIIPTHIHLDHAGGLGRLAQLFPQAKVVANPEGARHIINPTRLIQSTRVAFGEDFEAVYGPILPVPGSQVRVVKDGERLSAGSRELVIIYTPGHASHHIAILDTRVNGLFCGEALGLIYSPGAEPLPAVAAPSLDIEVYLSTMERLRRLKPGILFYSHGGIATEPERPISQAVANTKAIAEVVLQAVKAGKTDEEVTRSVGEFILSRFGIELSRYELTTVVSGYIYYFKKKGQLAG